MNDENEWDDSDEFKNFIFTEMYHLLELIKKEKKANGNPHLM